MSRSPFAFYRGCAKVMAEDLSDTPVTGITAQICGDAHLSNFGMYGSPERELVFDLNDFDETLPGPWEWDVKRLITSFVIAARNNGYPELERELAALAAKAYRDAMASFAAMSFLDAWYSHLRWEDIVETFSEQVTKEEGKKSRKFATKARSKDSLHALKKLAEEVDGRYRIVSQPPLLVPFRELPEMADEDEVRSLLHEEFSGYLHSVPDDLAVLLERYEPVDAAIKVVGVGSVGTRCAIVLLQGRDPKDVLFLQAKEANRSVLEDHLPESRYASHGQRVVEGQRLMQALSDGFLGWNVGDVTGTHYYWRQLKDMKGSMDVESATERQARRFTWLCGWTLARAHTRSGDAAAISAYLGTDDTFDQAMADFAVAYADQNERDYAAFTAAIESGRVEAHE